MVQAEEMTEDDFWFLNGRLRRRQGTRQLRLECNYDGHNWVYKLFNERKVGKLITTNTFDNEVNLPEDYIPNLKLLPKRLQDRHLYGTDDDAEGLVFDEFNYGRHVIDPIELPRDWCKGFGLDHGFRNPTAVLWYAVDYDGTIIIYDEHYEKEKPISYHAKEILKRGFEGGISDPSVFNKTYSKGETIYSIADEYRDEGVILRPAYRSAEDASIQRVNEYFRTDSLKITRNCVNAIREYQNWKWTAPRIDRNDKEEPIDKDNHACDVTKYIIASRPAASVKSKRIVGSPDSAWEKVLKNNPLNY